MKFKLNYYDREVQNNVRSAKVFARKEAKKAGNNLIEEYFDNVKFLFESMRGFSTIADALELNEDTNEIEIRNEKIDFEKLLEVNNIVLFFEVEERIGQRNVTVNEKVYNIESINQQIFDSPFVFSNLPTSFPREIGDYKIVVANSFEFNNIKDNGFKNKKISYNENSNYYFDFIGATMKLFNVIMSFGDLPGYPIMKKDVQKIKDFLLTIGYKAS